MSKKLIEHCELEWEEQCLNFHKNKRQVRTASIEQVRKPINNKSIVFSKRVLLFKGSVSKGVFLR